jgi:hypothetical protein
MKRRNCPYLGLQYDSSTCHAFPSEHNYCHKVSVPGPVDLEFQSSACLTENYLDCPIYNGIEEELPSNTTSSLRRSILRYGCIFAAIALGSVLVALAAPTVTGSSGVRSFIQFLAGPTQEVFHTPTMSVGGVVETVATATLIIPASSCNVPQGWTPYPLQAGDDLVAIANQRGIDLAAISQGNCNLDLLTLVAGDVIFLPPPVGQTETAQPSLTPVPTETVPPPASPTVTLEPSQTATFTPTPTATETPTPTITATFYYPPTPTSPPPPPTRKPRPTNPPPPPTQTEERPTSTPPPVRP